MVDINNILIKFLNFINLITKDYRRSYIGLMVLHTKTHYNYDYNKGSGYSSSSGQKITHAICPAQPRDTKCDAVASSKWQHVSDWVRKMKLL